MIRYPLAPLDAWKQEVRVKEDSRITLHRSRKICRKGRCGFRRRNRLEVVKFVASLSILLLYLWSHLSMWHNNVWFGWLLMNQSWVTITNRRAHRKICNMLQCVREFRLHSIWDRYLIEITRLPALEVLVIGGKYARIKRMVRFTLEKVYPRTYHIVAQRRITYTQEAT